MSYRPFVFTAAVASAGLSLMFIGFTGCGSSSSGGSSAGDGGEGGTLDSSMELDSGTGSETSAVDSGTPDTGGGGGDGGGGDGGCNSGGVNPSGTQLVKSATALVVGITSDDYALYYDSADTHLHAVALTGGAAADLGFADLSEVATSGPVALSWTGLTQLQTTGAFSVWTKAHGTQALGMTVQSGAVGGGTVDISADGKTVLFTDNTTASTTDLYVASIDGTGKPQALVTKMNLTSCKIGSNSLAPWVGFVGNTAVAAYCPGGGGGDAGAKGAVTIEGFSGAGWKTKTVYTTTGTYPVFRTERTTGKGTHILFLDAGGLEVAAADGSSPLALDPKATCGTKACSFPLTFTNDGKSVFYLDPKGFLWRSTIAASAPTEVNGSAAFGGDLALTSDDKWIELLEGQDSKTFLYNIFVTPTAAKSQLYTLVSGLTGSNFGDAFTADSKHVTFFANVGAGVGDFSTDSLPPSGSPTVLANNVWENFSTTGGKTLYNDHYACLAPCSTTTFNPANNGTADIESQDLSTSGGPTKLVSGADANFYVSADKKHIVYSWNYCSGAATGVYSMTAP